MNAYRLAGIILLVVATALLGFAAQLYYDAITPPFAATLGPVGVPLYVQLTIYGILFAIAGISLLWWYRPANTHRIRNKTDHP